jgi:Enoyl-CoA hydratase/carnithine racemase
MFQYVLRKRFKSIELFQTVRSLFSRSYSISRPPSEHAKEKYDGSILNNNEIEKTFYNFVKTTIPDECNVGDIDLTIDNASSIAIISMNNPKSLNAMSGQMMIEFNKITKHLSTSWKDGKAIVLTGANNQFCSGGDLKNFMNFLETEKLGYMMSCYMHKVMKDFSMLPMPTVAVIEGQTLGGGAEVCILLCNKKIF